MVLLVQRVQRPRLDDLCLDAVLLGELVGDPRAV
jgi:hypothetical protein